MILRDNKNSKNINRFLGVKREKLHYFIQSSKKEKKVQEKSNKIPSKDKGGIKDYRKITWK